MIASRTRPIWPCIHGLIGMNKGGTVEVAGLKVTMVRAGHSAGDMYAGAESPLYLGEPVGFVVELENGYRFYVAGDTDVFSDMRLIAERFRPNLAFPADRRPFHDVGNLTATERRPVIAATGSSLACRTLEAHPRAATISVSSVSRWPMPVDESAGSAATRGVAFRRRRTRSS